MQKKILDKAIAARLSGEWLAVTLCMLSVNASAQTAKEAASNTFATVSIEAYGDLFARATPVASHLSKVFIYRVNAVPTPQPVNIYLDGRYHTSLLKGGFSEFCAIPGAVSVQAVLDDASRQHLGKQDAGQRLQFDPGKTLFLRLQESSYAPPTLQVVNSTVAQMELKNSRRQIHTVSRAKSVHECEEGVEVSSVTPTTNAAPIAAVAIVKSGPERKYALEADALFEFGKAELRASGYNAIEILVQKVKGEFRSVERIRVVGYTDAIGPKKLNRKLSEDRAVTVAEQIRAGGVHPSKGIQTEGRGSLELVKTDCAIQPNPKNKQCHAPNRRVEIVVLGARR
jgi:OmpA-OmpF porin, OOP family